MDKVSVKSIFDKYDCDDKLNTVPIVLDLLITHHLELYIDCDIYYHLSIMRKDLLSEYFTTVEDYYRDYLTNIIDDAIKRMSSYNREYKINMIISIGDI